MSDPISNPSTAPAPIPAQTSADTSAGGAPVVNSVGTGPNQVIFDAPTPAAPEPLITEDWGNVYQLENGQFEMKMNSGQVYKGDQQQILREVGKANFHATRRIAELNGKTPPSLPADPNAAPNGVDPTALALADLTAQGFGYKNAEELKQFLSIVPTLQESYQQQQLNQTAADFLSTTPDFPSSPENADKIDATLAQFGLEPSVEALQMAHAYLKNSGQYARVQTPAKAAPGNMPPPPTGFTGEVQGLDAWSMPLDQLEDMLRRQ